jgi:hypothetical protein
MRTNALADAPSQEKANALRKEAKSKSPLGPDEVTMTVSADESTTTNSLTHSKVKHESSQDDIANSSGSDGLPSFARAGWAARFLPTLCHRLSNARDPWDIGNGADMLVVLQAVFDKAYPESGYKIEYGSKVYSMVCRLKLIFRLFTNIPTF